MRIRFVSILLKDAELVFKNWEPICLDDESDIKSFLEKDNSRTKEEINVLTRIFMDRSEDRESISRVCRDYDGTVLALSLIPKEGCNASSVFLSEDAFNLLSPLFKFLKIEVS